jgi:hypothetical protein
VDQFQFLLAMRQGRYRNAIGNKVDEMVPCEPRLMRLLGNREQDKTRIMAEERK